MIKSPFENNKNGGNGIIYIYEILKKWYPAYLDLRSICIHSVQEERFFVVINQIQNHSIVMLQWMVIPQATKSLSHRARTVA